MPRSRDVLNAFTASEVGTITGLSIHMVNYLRRIDFLAPAYGEGVTRRGRVRYYSYRDLVVGRLIQQLRAAGVELSCLKDALLRLRDEALWADTTDDIPPALRWLRTDGREVLIEREDGFLEYLRSDRQAAFGFVVNLGGLAREVREMIPAGAKREAFSLRNLAVRDARARG